MQNIDGEGNEKTEQSLVIKAIDWAYDKAIGGLPGLPGIEVFAESYLKSNNSDVEAAISDVIRWQIAQAGIVGVLTAMGGLVTLPAGVTANLASVLYLQLRMIAAIAHLRGYDVKSDSVKAFAIICLTGSSATDILKDVSIKFGEKVTIQLLKKIPGQLLTSINQMVGFRLLSKFGTTGIINLSKLIPIIGGLISGGIDATTTGVIASTAKSLFPKRRPEGETGPFDDAEASASDGPIIEGELNVNQLPS